MTWGAAGPSAHLFNNFQEFMMLEQTNQQRVLAREMAREMTADEIDQVGGGRIWAGNNSYDETYNGNLDYRWVDAVV
jgi:hypothetical protein